jgi:hypothetical protein
MSSSPQYVQIITQKLSVGTDENYKNMSGYLDSDKCWKWDLSNRKHKWQSQELRHSETGCEDGMWIELAQDHV